MMSFFAVDAVDATNRPEKTTRRKSNPAKTKGLSQG